VRRRLLISGRVQGVGYRWSARRQAQELGLRGWVRNLPTGQVEALVDGEDAAVLAFLSWCEEGPPSARVSGVEVHDADDAEAPADFRVELS
jgi:acylphosphatase